MKLIALTGGLGMGKSTAADWLWKRGVPLVDSDQIARQVTEPGQPALAEIQAEFGALVMDAEGRLIRTELARWVFADPAARQKLEAILHPRIQREWRARAEQWRQGGCRLGVAVIPLLYETRGETSFDAVVCVACSAATQCRRLLTRGWSEAEIQQRIQAQMPVGKKMALADFVVWNEGSLELLDAQMTRIFQRWQEPDNLSTGRADCQ
jgi:dephospho-CoA kinase